MQTQPEPVSTLELEGPGEAVWKDIDANRHVERERSSWG